MWISMEVHVFTVIRKVKEDHFADVEGRNLR